MKNTIVLIIIFTFFSADAAAKPYIGIGGGSAKSEEITANEIQVPYVYVPGSSNTGNINHFSQKSKDSAFKLYGGYTYNDFLSLNFGYLDLGENEFSISRTTIRSTTNLINNSGSLSAKASVNGFYFSVSPSLKLNKDFSIHGTVGVYAWDIKGNASSSSLTTYTNLSPVITNDTFTIDNNGIDPFFGVGLKYKFIQLEYEKYDIDSATTEYAGISLRFNLPNQ